jgi:cation transport ATPase
MTEPASAEGLGAAPAGPAGARVRCAGCGAPLDALRAGHVAIFGATLKFFCDAGDCRSRFVARRAGSEPPEAEPAPRADALAPDRGAVEAARAPPAPQPELAGELLEPLAAPVESAPPLIGMEGERREVALLLVALALLAGLLAMALELAVPSRLVGAARVLLLAVATAAIAGGALCQPPDAAVPHRALGAVAPGLATLLGAVVLVGGGTEALGRACFLGATVVSVSALVAWLVGGARRRALAARRAIAEQLARPAWRLTRLGSKELAHDVRPGEEVVVEEGDVVPVDLEIVDGEAEILPWVDATTPQSRRRGDRVVAGARVRRGQLRGVCTASGGDRSLARPLLSAARRADVHADLPRLGRALAVRGALVAAVLAALAGVLLGRGALGVALLVVAVVAALANEAVALVPALAVAGGVRAALGRGIAYASAETWARCARAGVAVFCARGTLLRGEPEVCDVRVPPGAPTTDPGEVLSLAAGALAVERAPAARAIRRAARDRGVEADAVRNPRAEPSGVAAVSSRGEPLLVGNRALMLERHVSVAAAEETVRDLESAGRSVVLVAHGGRLVGLCGLQDGVRAGARAAVQHLLDARVEPVLMSSDSTQTCEALGRALDIDHLRPEVAPDQAAEAVERIRQTGATVAVIGHEGVDDEALRAADAPVVLAGAGRGDDAAAVALVGDDVRDAALALALARRTRAHAALALGLVLGPALLGALVATAGLLPAEYAPLALLLGATAAVAQLRGAHG